MGTTADGIGDIPERKYQRATRKCGFSFGRYVEMSLFLDAAVCWKNMLDISYTFVIGHKRDIQTIQLQFQPDEFAHLSGFHYVTDVDFHLPRQALYGKKLIQAVISGKIQETSIEKSTHWDKVSQRLQDILFLEKILDDDFQIFQFHAYKLPFHSKIDANYLIYSTKYQTGIFLFIDREQSRDYCRSIFSKDSRDYTINQTQWTILEKRKCMHGQEKLLFVHPSFHDL